ncbi:MAG: HEAT repeat domain-containing protein [Chloroflexota bacterium]
MTDTPDIQTLIDALRDPDWQVRYDAADRLKVIGDARAVPALIDVLNDENPTVKFIAAMTLGIIQDASAVDPLVAMLRASDDDSLLWASAWALSEMGALSSEPLIDLLDSEDAITRDVAADVLGGLADARAVPHLLDALMKHGMADYPETGRFGAADALERFDELSLTSFVQALYHSHPDIRARAADALGNIGLPEAIPALVSCLEDTAQANTPQGPIRVCDVAASALREIGTPEAEKAIQAWAKGAS